MSDDQDAQQDELDELANDQEANNLEAFSDEAALGPAISGIYQIRNVQTGRIYIGRSRNIHTRWLAHRDALNRGVHINENLQSDWEAFGERAFEFTVLEEISGLDALIQAEGRHLSLINHPYNIQSVPFNPEVILTVIEARNERRRITPSEFFAWLAYINTCVRAEAIHEELTQKWRARGVESDEQIALLTDTMSKGILDVTTGEHREIKRLGPRAVLRNSYTRRESLFMEIGEEAATGLHQERDSQGFDALQTDVRDAAKVAGDLRRHFEVETGLKVVSSENYKTLRQARQRELQPPLFGEGEAPGE